MLTAKKIHVTNQSHRFYFTREIRRVARFPAFALLAALSLAACKPDAEKPAPHTLTDAAIGHYCGMMLTEHEGPKGQIFLKGVDEPVWFSSAHDTLAFTLLPEEPKDIAAIYVSDMGTAPSWADPGPDNWTDARAASFVIGSDAQSAMGGTEAVPFADKTKAEAFARDHGGQVYAFDAIPPDAILVTADIADTDDADDAPEHEAPHDH